jgi:hypothetical protein
MVAVANAFMERIILSLLPFFLVATPDRDEARAAIVGALASYGACTQHDLTETAQILALGFSVVDSLAESTGGGVSITKRLRLRGAAVALIRSKKTCVQALSDNRYISEGLHAEVAVSANVPECANTAEPAQPEHARDDTQPAAPHSIFQLARDRGRQTDDSAAEATPDLTRPASTAVIAPLSCQAAVPPLDEQEEHAMLWAGVMSKAADKHTGTHATG